MNPEHGQEEHEEHRRADFASKKGEIVLRKHEYDGIQEYDQKLPNWWLVTFFGAVIFYLIYWFAYYQAGLIETDQDAVTDAIAEIQKEKAEALEKTLANLNDKVLVNEWATDGSIVAEGEKIYSQVCIGCHGPELDAPTKLGLSLVDHEWKYGDRPMEIFKLINEGSPSESKGMPPTGAKMIPWGATYSGKQVAQMVAFIISKNPEDFAKFKD
jgi:cytochrome c oxidase cbb3-type subunit 3